MDPTLTPNPSPDAGNGNGGAGNPSVSSGGAAGGGRGFIFPTRRPLMSRTFKQTALIQAYFGEEPVRSYYAQFVPPQLLPSDLRDRFAGANEDQSSNSRWFRSEITRRGNMRNENARVNEGQSSTSSQLPSDIRNPVQEGVRHDMEVANEKEDYGDLDDARKEVVGEETMAYQSTQVVYNANISLGKSEMVADESSGSKGAESGRQVLVDDGVGDVSVHVGNCQEPLAIIEKALMDESPNIGQLPIHNGSEAINSFWDMNLHSEGTKQDVGSPKGITSCLEGTKVGEEASEKQQNDMDTDKLVNDNEGVVFPYVSVDEGMEEGEIPNEAELDEPSYDLSMEDATPMSDEEVHEKSNLNDVSGGSMGIQVGESGTIEESCKCDVVARDKAMRMEDHMSALKISKSQSSNHIFYTRDQLLNLRQGALFPGDILKIKQEVEVELHVGHQNQAESGNKVNGVSSKRKLVDIVEDDDNLNKEGTDTSKKGRKRGPGSKEKKKQKERKRRAEKNKKLGVKRVTMQPILKPQKKDANICRHYRMGKCHEGDNCKFSHDVVPDTKSKPCSFFSRQACMKGEKCPFDHELSKYPCHNYTSNGFCSRQDSCLFSHKIVAKEGSESKIDVAKSESKPSDPPNKSITKQQSNSGYLFSQKIPSKEGSGSAKPVFEFKSSALLNNSTAKHHPTLGTRNFTGTNMATNVPLVTSDQLASAPKGFSLFGKPIINASPKQRHVGSSTESGNGFGTQPNQVIQKGSQAMLPPKGITLLSFGGTSTVDSFHGKETSLLTKTEKDFDSSVHGKGTGDKLPPSNITPNGPSGNLPVDTTRGKTYQRFARTSSTDGHGEKQAILSTQAAKGLDSAVHDKGSDNGLQLSNARPHGLPDLEFSPGLSSNKLVDTPRVFTFQSLGKTSSIDDTNGKQACLPIKTDKGFEFSFLGMGSSTRLQPSNVGAQGAMDHPFSFGFGSKKLEEEQARTTPYSAPKGLSSTLAFAARYETVIRRNASAGMAPCNTEQSKSADAGSSSGSTKSEPIKPTEIHNLLFGGNRSTK